MKQDELDLALAIIAAGRFVNETWPEPENTPAKMAAALDIDRNRARYLFVYWLSKGWYTWVGEGIGAGALTAKGRARFTDV